MDGERSTGCRRAHLMGLALLLCVPAAAWARGGEPRVAKVPDVRSIRQGEARRRIEAAGFRVGRIYEVSAARIRRGFKVRFPVGYVFLQAPSFTEVKPLGTPVHLTVVAVRDGPEMPPGVEQLRDPAEERPREDEPADPPRTAPPEDAPADDNAVPPATEDDPSPPVARGSPDAPRAAPPPDPDVVPSMTGLVLAEAEQLARGADMKLHVERVGGHPIGRVLEQVPRAGAKRPPGGMVKVVVTAGGDYEGQVPDAPEVYLPEIEVPGLLDRTVLQARRILGDLDLVIQEEDARRGLPGRVVDQMPAAGGKVARGGIVRVWIGPGEGGVAPADDPPPMGPLRPEDGGDPSPAEEKPDGAPQPAQPDRDLPPAPGPLPKGVPKPIAPGTNTALPAGESVPVGFTWRGVQGATAYLLEIEEEGAEGRWLPNARKPSRKTAVLLEVERLDPRGRRRLRWRVRAMFDGREGPASPWILLR